MKKNSNKTDNLRAIPFVAVVLCLMIIGFIVPLRPTYSMDEKRELTHFPKLTAESLSDGSYFSSLSMWYSDTFPGRETFLNISAGINKMHGVQENRVDPDVIKQAALQNGITEKQVETEIWEDDTEILYQEAEETAEPEEITVSEEKENTDNAPSENEWKGIEADENLHLSSIIQIGDTLYGYYGFVQSDADRRIQLLSEAVEAHDGEGIKFYDLLVPTSVGVTVSSKSQEKLKCSNQSDALNYIYSRESDSITKVNVFNNLVAHNDEYIYFRTDHHWTALGAWYAYEEFCRTAGLDAVPLSEYTEIDTGEFSGTLSSKAPMYNDIRYDELYAYDPPGDITFTIGLDTKYPVLFDRTKSYRNTKYITFIGGDHGLSVITNNGLEGGKSCAVIKDSQGNPFSIYLSQNYYKVYILDYRYFKIDDYYKYAKDFSEFCDYFDISDVLFVESLSLGMSDAAVGSTVHILK